MKYVCTVCGYIYDEAAGEPDSGIEAGTKWGGCSGRFRLSPVRCWQRPIRSRRIIRAKEQAAAERSLLFAIDQKWRLYDFTLSS